MLINHNESFYVFKVKNLPAISPNPNSFGTFGLRSIHTWIHFSLASTSTTLFITVLSQPKERDKIRINDVVSLVVSEVSGNLAKPNEEFILFSFSHFYSQSLALH